jgi:hypothetical protein
VPQQPDLISLYVAPLNRTGIEYMVTGAVAAIVYGEPRLTNDIDVVIALQPPDVPGLTAAFAEQDFYVPPPEAIVTEIQRTNYGHFNIIHRVTSLKADFYPVAEDELHRWAMLHRRRIGVSGEEVSIAPPEYVVVRKLEYYRAGGSDKHLRDIRAMLRIQDNQIDLETIATQVRRLGLEDEWQAVGSS